MPVECPCQKLRRGTWEEGNQEAICKQVVAETRGDGQCEKNWGRGTGGADLEEMGGQRRPFRGDGEGGKTGRQRKRPSVAAKEM